MQCTDIQTEAYVHKFLNTTEKEKKTCPDAEHPQNAINCTLHEGTALYHSE